MIDLLLTCHIYTQLSDFILNWRISYHFQISTELSDFKLSYFELNSHNLQLTVRFIPNCQMHHSTFIYITKLSDFTLKCQIFSIQLSGLSIQWTVFSLQSSDCILNCQTYHLNVKFYHLIVRRLPFIVRFPLNCWMNHLIVKFHSIVGFNTQLPDLSLICQISTQLSNVHSIVRFI